MLISYAGIFDITWEQMQNIDLHTPVKFIWYIKYDKMKWLDKKHIIYIGYLVVVDKIMKTP